jgi:hypothetical protein
MVYWELRLVLIKRLGTLINTVITRVLGRIRVNKEWVWANTTISIRNSQVFERLRLKTLNIRGKLARINKHFKGGKNKHYLRWINSIKKRLEITARNNWEIVRQNW